MKNVVTLDGEIIQNLDVLVFFPKKRAPFLRFAVINVGRKLPVSELSGLEGKLLLQLIFFAKPLALKDLARIVGTPTSCAVRSLNRLISLGLVEKPDRGIYRASRDLVHYGRWPQKEIGQKGNAE